MANQNGSVYGLTLLCPIRDDERATPSHDLQIRRYLASLPTGGASPFAIAPYTHLARLAVMDDVIFVGTPAREEHLKSKYLVFEANTDVDLEPYVTALAQHAPTEVDAIWSHCAGYPGLADLAAFVKFMKACQVPTTFFFAAVTDKSVTQTLKALATQRAVSDFIVAHQGMDPATVQQDFLGLAETLRTTPPPLPGGSRPKREIETGGRNE